jgi:alanine racemase
MVKADAYGMGLAPVANALRRALPPHLLWAFGVAAVAEGEALRACGWRGRIVVFAPTPPGEYERAAAADLSLALSEAEAVRRWAKAARRSGRRRAFHTEIDTGMGRAGFPCRAAARWGIEVERDAAEWLRWEGVFTHFYSADEADSAPTELQWQRFRSALGQLPPGQTDIQRRVVHAANSAAALRFPPTACDLVRPGIALYGGAAGPDDHPHAVAALRARVVLVREVPERTTVGYGATYAARRTERWATLAIGYGDGVPRALGPGGGEVLLNGARAPIIGRISMDVTVVDVSSVPGVETGGVATLIGRDGDEEITVDEVAARCGTISYEILSGLGPRLPRIYRDARPDPAR